MNTYDNDGNVVSLEKGTPELTIGYILAQMEKIRSDSAHVNEAIKSISEMPGDGHNSRAGALGAAVDAREKTNRKMLEMYEVMYRDLRPEPKEMNRHVQEKMLQVAKEMIENSEDFGQRFADDFGEAFKKVFMS